MQPHVTPTVTTTFHLHPHGCKFQIYCPPRLTATCWTSLWCIMIECDRVHKGGLTSSDPAAARGEYRAILPIREVFGIIWARGRRLGDGLLPYILNLNKIMKTVGWYGCTVAAPFDATPTRLDRLFRYSAICQDYGIGALPG